VQTATDLIFGPLNDEQKQAVVTMDGPVLILAGAGSGKTRALTHRIANLIHTGVQPWQILAVTFTNKAAKEMKERIKNLLHLTEGEDLSPYEAGHARLPTMGTFHSICARVLRRDIERLGRDRSFVIYDGDDQERLMKEVLRELQIAEEQLKPRAALSQLGRMKCEAVTPEQARKDASGDRMQTVVRAYDLYQKKLREANAVDFDDLMLETIRLFKECPDVLDRYQETWRYIHVDEYQDTNHAQYLLISMLAEKYRNIAVIGDPDQSIYGFRGADIRNILEFEREYKDAVRIKLERNYRSTQPILSSADKVISVNPNRPEKHMWTERTDGPKVIVHQVSNERKEAEEAVKAIRQIQSEGIPLKEQVILYRTHAQSRVFEEACMRSGIPYRILGGLKFYMRKEVKDVLAYLHAITNPYDALSILRVINVPARKIGLRTLERLQEFASVYSMQLWDALKHIDDVPEIDNGAKERVRQFIGIVERFKMRSTQVVVSTLTEELLNAIGMEKWLLDSDDEKGEERWQNVKELLTVMHKYDGLDPQASLMSFLEEAALVSEVDKLEEGGDALTLMTLHLCKGLEFEHVMIVGCEEGLFPHSNAVYDKEQLEEERRIMYVGMTRARTHLRLFFASERFLWGEQKATAPSRFLDDLPPEFVERRSDDVLSAFAWAGQSGVQKVRAKGTLMPFRQGGNDDDGFNQDSGDDSAQQGGEIDVQSRVEHPVFGKGTVASKRGDVVDIRFDNGQKKTFALSIAPLKLL
jgi:DNA helicase-2/ATP-dependent DNA helicase PcrA